MFVAGPESSRACLAALWLLCLLTTSLAGCAAKVSGQPDAKSQFADDGPATLASWADQSSVKASLGEPVRTFLDGRVWVYEETFQGRWVSIFPIPVPNRNMPVLPAPATYVADTPVFRVFEFDQSGALIAQRRVPGEKRCDDGVCISLGVPDDSIGLPIMSAYTGAFTVDAPSWHMDDLRAATILDKCVLFLYDTRRIRSSGARIWLDGAPAGSLLSQDSYQRWELPPGRHQLYVRSRLESALRTVDCSAGAEIYLRFRAKDDGRLELIEPDKARKKLAKKELVLSDWPRGALRPGVGLAPDMRLEWLKAGVTSGAELVNRLGPPDLRLQQPSLLVYAAGAPRWAQLTGIELGDSRFNDLYMFVARFDDQDILLRWEVMLANAMHLQQLRVGTMQGAESQRSFGTSNLRQCTEYGVCFSDGGLAARFASTQVDLQAQDYVTKVRSAPDGRCVAYLWSDAPAGSFRVRLDGVVQGYLYNRVWPDGVFIWDLADGDSELNVEWLNSPQGPVSQAADLQCAGGKNIKVELKTNDGELEISARRSLRPPRVEVSERRYLPSPAGKFDEYQPSFPRLQ